MKLNKMQITSRNSIIKYSQFAGAYLLMHSNLNAQVIYTDIEPDIELRFDNETCGIDMDNNGTFDFAFLKTSGTYDHWNSTTTVIRFRHAIWVGPYGTSENEIAGDIYTHSGDGTDYMPYAFVNGVLIDPGFQNFNNAGYQIMGLGFYTQDTIWIGYLGKWAPDVEDHFLGVKFVDEALCYHYGWIRCSTADTTKRLIIKDYAFETHCGTPIRAGDTISYVDIQQIENTINAIVYSYDNSIYIQLIETLNEPVVTVFDLLGNKVYSSKLVNSFSTIELKLTQGYYLVEINSNEKKFVKKIYMN
ncbi:MAG: T9SS type A sorting domain-containing protein [Chitinophagales bacterium]